MTRLDAGNTYNGVTELLINGQSAGIKWYGERIFDIGGKLLPGKNTVTVRVTTVLGNYCKSLKDNATAQQWTQRGNLTCRSDSAARYGCSDRYVRIRTDKE